jgi:hypothetical protein
MPYVNLLAVERNSALKSAAHRRKALAAIVRIWLHRRRRAADDAEFHWWPFVAPALPSFLNSRTFAMAMAVCVGRSPSG